MSEVPSNYAAGQLCPAKKPHSHNDCEAFLLQILIRFFCLSHNDIGAQRDLVIKEIGIVVG